MINLVVRRLLALPLILLATALIIFALAWTSPFDPGEAYVMAYGPEVTREMREQYARARGVDRPTSTAERCSTPCRSGARCPFPASLRS